MADSLAAVVLSAGAGERLQPLTRWLPKVLCPVDGVALVDGNLARVSAVVGSGPDHVAVNVHVGTARPAAPGSTARLAAPGSTARLAAPGSTVRLAAPGGTARLAAHVAGRAHVSEESDVALGTAGGVAHLRPWLEGRPALVVNGDTWSTVDLEPLVADWDGQRVRVLVAEPVAELRPGVRILGSLLPAAVIGGLPHRPAGLMESCWAPELAAGRLEVVAAAGPCISCDRPRDYLAANLAASGGESVVGEGARVDGTLVRSVVWPGGVVWPGEVLVDSIRVDDCHTVAVR